jgi:antitoxin component HigA of HigAB toxin-antitoxin module
MLHMRHNILALREIDPIESEDNGRMSAHGHVPDEPMEPIEYLKASMDNRGLAQKDLSMLLGSSSRAAEVLNGKRELSKAMIRALAEE